MKDWIKIGELTDKQILGTEGYSSQPPRQKARSIVINEAEKYAVIYEESTNSYALPGGGIEPGEDAQSAIIREVNEETGCSCADLTPLGIILENRFHEDSTRISYFFLAYVRTGMERQHLTDEETELGTSIIWCSLEEAMQLINGYTPKTNQKKFQQARDMLALQYFIKNSKFLFSPPVGLGGRPAD